VPSRNKKWQQAEELKWMAAKTDVAQNGNREKFHAFLYVILCNLSLNTLIDAGAFMIVRDIPSSFNNQLNLKD
jgi:hypothetical protein